MNFSRKLAVAVIAVGCIAGCAPVDPGLGEALRYDMAIQTVDPDPVYAEDGAQPGDSGVHAARATEAYRKGTVKEPKAPKVGSGPQ